MDILHLIDRLEEIVADARRLPIGGGTVVSRQQLLDLVDRMRVAVPGEVYEARDVIERRDEVVREGELRAEEIVGEAREELERRLGQTEMVKAAQERAAEVVAQAEERARELCARRKSRHAPGSTRRNRPAAKRCVRPTSTPCRRCAGWRSSSRVSSTRSTTASTRSRRGRRRGRERSKGWLQPSKRKISTAKMTDDPLRRKSRSSSVITGLFAFTARPSSLT